MLVIEYHKIPIEIWSYILYFLDSKSIINFSLFSKLTNNDLNLSIEIGKYAYLQLYYRKIPILRTINNAYKNIHTINSLSKKMDIYCQVYNIIGYSKNVLDTSYISLSKQYSFMEDYINYLRIKKPKYSKRIKTIFHYIYVSNRYYKHEYKKTFFNIKNLYLLSQ